MREANSDWVYHKVECLTICCMSMLLLFDPPLTPCWFLHRSVSGYNIECRGISGYQVEKKGKRGDWTKANIKPVDDTTYTVSGLPEGAELEFRVAAVNDAGPGKPSKTTGKHIVRDPVCKCWTIVYWVN